MFLLNGKTEKTIGALKSLLLTNYEAKVYFTLLVLGENKPFRIARMSGVPQPKVYAVLAELEERKLAVQTQAKPAMFKANPLNLALEQFRAERIEEVRRATVSAQFLTDILPSLEKVAQEFEGQFRIFESPLRRR